MEKNNLKPKRERKGESILDLVDNYIVVDIETTGLVPRYDDIIEICALKVSHGNITDEFNSLINPGYKIDEFITELTGITNKMLIHAPILKDLLPSFLDFIGDGYVLGHNVNFDINFLYDNCISILSKPLTNNFIDTMRISRRLFKNLKSHKLSVLVDEFNIDNKVSHRARGDCLCTFKLYKHLCEYIRKNNLDINVLCSTKRSNSTKRAN